MLTLKFASPALLTLLLVVGCGGPRLPTQAETDLACDRMKNGPVDPFASFAGSDPSADTMPYLNTSQRMDIAIPRGNAGNFEGFLRAASPVDSGTFFLYSSAVLTLAGNGPRTLTIEGCPEIAIGYAIDLEPSTSGDSRGPAVHLISDVTDVKLVYFKAP